MIKYLLAILIIVFFGCSQSQETSSDYFTEQNTEIKKQINILIDSVKNYPEPSVYKDVMRYDKIFNDLYDDLDSINSNEELIQWEKKLYWPFAYMETRDLEFNYYVNELQDLSFEEFNANLSYVKYRLLLLKLATLNRVFESFTISRYKISNLNYGKLSYVYASINDTTHVFYGIFSDSTVFYLRSEDPLYQKKIRRNIYYGKLDSVLDKKKIDVYFKTSFGGIVNDIWLDGNYKNRLFQLDSSLIK